MPDDDLDECDPFNSICIDPNGPCEECNEFWLDFHAGALQEELELQ